MRGSPCGCAVRVPFLAKSQSCTAKVSWEVCAYVGIVSYALFLKQTSTCINFELALTVRIAFYIWSICVAEKCTMFSKKTVGLPRSWSWGSIHMILNEQINQDTMIGDWRWRLIEQSSRLQFWWAYNFSIMRIISTKYAKHSLSDFVTALFWQLIRNNFDRERCTFFMTIWSRRGEIPLWMSHIQLRRIIHCDT